MMKKILGIIIIFLIHILNCKSQTSFSFKNKGIYKKYEIKDSLSGKAACLILFSDNTFLNFGTGKPGEKTDEIWFTVGRWLGNKEMVMCRTFNQIDNQEQVIGEIKSSFMNASRFPILPGNTNFRKIDYLDYVFAFNNAGIKDKENSLNYFEVK